MCECVCACARVITQNQLNNRLLFFKQFDFCFLKQQKFRRGQPKSIELEQRNEFDANFLLFRRAVFNYSKKLLRPIDFPAASLPSISSPPTHPQKNSLKLFPFSDQNIPSPSIGFKCVFAIFSSLMGETGADGTRTVCSPGRNSMKM